MKEVLRDDAPLRATIYNTLLNSSKVASLLNMATFHDVLMRHTDDKMTTLNLSSTLYREIDE